MISDPYLVLGVSTQADDEQINAAYLQKVRQFPPERSPQIFKQTREAYETLRTQRDRLRYQLIQTEAPDLYQQIVSMLNSVDPGPVPGLPSEELVLSALAAGLLEQNIDE